MKNSTPIISTPGPEPRAQGTIVHSTAPETAAPGGEFAGATPGPWHVEKECGRFAIWPKDNGHTHTFVGVVQTKADANLVAAAPALLAQRDAARAEVATLRNGIAGVIRCLDGSQPKDPDGALWGLQYLLGIEPGSPPQPDEARSLAASLDAALAELRQRTRERDQARRAIETVLFGHASVPLPGFETDEAILRAALGADR